MKRALATVATAAALLLLPAAAQAYPAPTTVATVSNPSPAVGEPVTVTVGGLETASSATMTVTSSDPSIPNTAIAIAGTASYTKEVPGDSVSFTVTHSVDGVYTHQITTDAGHVIPAQVLTVGTGGSGAGSEGTAGAGSGSTDASGATDGLAATGIGTAGELALLAGGLVVLGVGGTLLVRRGTRARA